MKALDITWQEIAEKLTIIDGKLWRKRADGGFKVVPTVSHDKKGYVTLRINGRFIMYHRALFMLHHKVTLTAVQYVDHIIEGNSGDNRIENLQILSHADNLRKSKTYTLPTRNKYGKLLVGIGINGYRLHIASVSEESEYWTIHAKRLRLFGVGTKGLAFMQTLNKADAKEFLQLAMVT